jgi:prolipoprotein diacylglyceryltransferase
MSGWNGGCGLYGGLRGAVVCVVLAIWFNHLPLMP